MLTILKEDNDLYILDAENKKICRMIGTEHEQSLWSHSICHAVNKVTDEYIEEVEKSFEEN